VPPLVRRINMVEGPPESSCQVTEAASEIEATQRLRHRRILIQREVMISLVMAELTDRIH
jgi:hypothetical protein